MSTNNTFYNFYNVQNVCGIMPPCPEKSGI